MYSSNHEPKSRLKLVCRTDCEWDGDICAKKTFRFYFYFYHIVNSTTVLKRITSKTVEKNDLKNTKPSDHC